MSVAKLLLFNVVLLKFQTLSLAKEEKVHICSNFVCDLGYILLDPNLIMKGRTTKEALRLTIKSKGFG
jgi:hypothetical protein